MACSNPIIRLHTVFALGVLLAWAAPGRAFQVVERAPNEGANGLHGNTTGCPACATNNLLPNLKTQLSPSLSQGSSGGTDAPDNSKPYRPDVNTVKITTALDAIFAHQIYSLPAVQKLKPQGH